MTYIKIETVSKFIYKNNDQKICCSQGIAENAPDQSYCSFLWSAASQEETDISD